MTSFCTRAASVSWQGCNAPGATRSEIRDESTVNGLDCAVSLAPLPATETWGLWDMALSVPGREPLRMRVCDFQSAGDDPSAVDADAFTIWF